MYYTDDVNLTYTVLIPNALWDAGAKLFGIYCDYPTGEARAACLGRYVQEIGHGVLDAAKGHLAWTDAHPAAACFNDAYIDDQAAAHAYVRAAKFLLAWDFSNWSTWLAKADNRGDAFLQGFEGYFKDCR